MDRVTLFRETLGAFDRVFVPPEQDPNIARIRELIEMLLAIEKRRDEPSLLTLTNEEERWLRLLAEGKPGILGGFDGYDVSDNKLGDLLCDAQVEARKMKKELLGRG